MEKENEKNKFKILNANTLKFIALIFMICDHLWGTILPGNDWLTIIGRLAFPIFAFFIVEGFYHTKDFKKYIKRLFIFALISEIPFNLMIGGSIIYPFMQNVMFTFLISLLLMNSIEKTYKKGDKTKFRVKSLAFTVLGFILGSVLFVDYFGYGVLMTLGFYFAKKMPKKLAIVFEILFMVYINAFLIEGLTTPFNIFGREIFIPRQAFAVFSLILIWMYNGELGKKNKFIQYGFYIIYPLHMLIFSLLAL